MRDIGVPCGGDIDARESDDPDKGEIVLPPIGLGAAAAAIGDPR